MLGWQIAVLGGGWQAGCSWCCEAWVKARRGKHLLCTSCGPACTCVWDKPAGPQAAPPTPTPPFLQLPALPARHAMHLAEDEGEAAAIDFGSDEEGRAGGGGDAAARKEARKKKKEERRRLKKERRRAEKKAAAATAAAGGGAEQKKGRLKKRSREAAVAALGA